MIEKRKILHVLSNLDAGGVGVVTRNLMNEFYNQGHEVSVLYIKNHGKKLLLNENIKVYSMGIKSIYNPVSIIFIYIKACIFFIKHREYTNIIIPGINYAFLIIPILKLLNHPATVLVNVHTNVTEYAKNLPPFKKTVFGLNRYILRLADRIANDSIGAAKDTVNYFGIKPVEVLYNPICTQEDLKFEESPSKAPHEWLKNRSLTTFVTCGRLIKSKNFDFMINVFAELYQNDKTLRLILIGDGEERKNLTNSIKTLDLSSVIDFVGYKSNPKQFFFHADYFWLTSLFEGSPLVLGEALSMGTPCIANDCPSGPREILQDGQYGLLIENYDKKHNQDEIALFIKEDINNKSFYRQRAKKFLSETIAKQYL